MTRREYVEEVLGRPVPNLMQGDKLADENFKSNVDAIAEMFISLADIND